MSTLITGRRNGARRRAPSAHFARARRAAAALQRRLEAIAPRRRARELSGARASSAPSSSPPQTRLRMLRRRAAELPRGGARPLRRRAAAREPLADFDPLLARIERLVPGEGPLAERVDALHGPLHHPARPARRGDARGDRRMPAPHARPYPAAAPSERFTLEFVTGKSWSGYNWYQGNYRSLIQVNTDQPVRMGRAIDLGCHEGYPGHHVYNMLLEQRAGARARLDRVSWSIRFIRRRASSPRARPITASSSPFPGDERLASSAASSIRSPASRPDDADAYLGAGGDPASSAGARFTIARDLLDGRIDARAGDRADPALPADVARARAGSRSPSPSIIAPM